MTLEEKAARGTKAQALLEDELFRDAIGKVQQHVFDQFAETDPADTGTLTRLRIKLQCIAEVVREMREVANTGKIAKHEIERESLAMKAKRRLGMR